MLPYDRVVSPPALGRLLAGWETDDSHAYVALASRISLLVLDGRVSLRTRLPSERELASVLNLSRATVAKAYARLRERGFLASQQGSGSWIRLPGDSTQPPSGVSMESVPGLIDLRQASPSAPSGLHIAVQAAADDLPRHLKDNGYSLDGLPALRSIIAQRYQEQGAPTMAEQIHVTSGAQHALGLVLRAFTKPGDRILVDDPTYPNGLDAIRQAGLRPVSVPLTNQGWDLDMFAATLRRTDARVAYLIPDFHNPTGFLLNEDGRERLAAIAARNRTILVIDETMRELGVDTKPLAPLSAYAKSGQIISLGSASKSFWGGLRVGWIRTDLEKFGSLTQTRRSVDLGTPILEQLIAAYLLTHDDDYLPQRIQSLREQRDALIGALTQHVSNWSWRSPEGGLSLWVDLGEAVSSKLAANAPDFGLSIVAGPRFGADGGHERHLRIPFTLPIDSYQEIGERLGQLASSPLRTRRVKAESGVI
ncbi:MAG TPA: PLP-dependent aminotransferase family protein [Candidatus Nanopelagicaceae bacterium]|nr:PLP-dependent aminotransferase family protein [Candidatus Nanopelagicaceae bacterium]